MSSLVNGVDISKFLDINCGVVVGDKSVCPTIHVAINAVDVQVLLMRIVCASLDVRYIIHF